MCRLIFIIFSIYISSSYATDLSPQFYQRQSQFTSTIQSWQTALSQTSPEHTKYIDLLIKLSQAHQQLGRYSIAQSQLVEAQTIAQYQDDELRQATILMLLSELSRLQGKQVIARTQINQAVELFNQLSTKPSDLLAQLLNQQGNIFMMDRNYQKAEKNYLMALEAAYSSKQSILVAKILVNQAQVFLKTNESVDKISTTLQQALQTIQTTELNDEKLKLLLHISQLQQKLIPKMPQLIETNYQLLQQIIKISPQFPYLHSQATAQLAQLYQQQQRYTEAIQLMRQAIFTAQQIPAPDLLYRWERQLGQLWLAQGDKLQAIAAYQQAVTHLNPIRYSVMKIHTYDEPTHFRETEAGQVYFELVDLLLQQAQQSQDSQQQAYLQQTKQTLELFRQAELENYFQDECITAKKPDLLTIQDKLAHVAILYPIIFTNHISLLLYFPQNNHLSLVEVPTTDIGSDLGEFLSELTTRLPDKVEAILPTAQALYQLLIQPISQAIAQTELLVIVPDEQLRAVPFAALHDGQQFLIEKYALAITPSLQLTDISLPQWQAIHVFSNGLSKSVQGFQSLPYTHFELKSIKSLYQTDELLDEQFTKQAFSKKLHTNNYSIVHVASHGNFAIDPQDSFLLTYDDRIYMNELKSYFHQFRGNPIELLTLSACQSAQGNDRAALGLAGIAIKSGTKSALASLWQVNDQATCYLMSTFYHILQNKEISKAKALQQAQIQLLKNDISPINIQACQLPNETIHTYQHPVYWAGFLLIGNWW